MPIECVFEYTPALRCIACMGAVLHTFCIQFMHMDRNRFMFAKTLWCLKLSCSKCIWSIVLSGQRPIEHACQRHKHIILQRQQRLTQTLNKPAQRFSPKVLLWDSQNFQFVFKSFCLWQAALMCDIVDLAMPDLHENVNFESIPCLRTAETCTCTHTASPLQR